MIRYPASNSAFPMRPFLLVGILAVAPSLGLSDDLEISGVLDRSLFDSESVPTTSAPQRFAVDPEALREQVQVEQETLEALPRPQLQALADEGERGAQIALGTGFAREAALLSFAPAAANDALADAVKWYSIAASRGFPGAPSLDQAGIRFYPIRIQRERRP